MNGSPNYKRVFSVSYHEDLIATVRQYISRDDMVAIEFCLRTTSKTPSYEDIHTIPITYGEACKRFGSEMINYFLGQTKYSYKMFLQQQEANAKTYTTKTIDGKNIDYSDTHFFQAGNQ